MGKRTKMVVWLLVIGLIWVFHVYAIGALVIGYIVVVILRISDTDETVVEAVYNTNKQVKVQTKVVVPLVTKRVNTYCDHVGEEFDSIKVASEIDLELAGSNTREALRQALKEERIDWKEFIDRTDELEKALEIKKASNKTAKEELAAIKKMTPNEKAAYKAARTKK